jgi:hypothetical protein
VRKAAIAAVVILAAIATWLAVTPFDRPQPRGTFTYGPGFETHCSAPIIGAWHAHKEGGWRGYAPLTSAPTSFPTCQGESRDRLAWASVWLAGSAVVLVVLLRRKRVSTDMGTQDTTP